MNSSSCFRIVFALFMVSIVTVACATLKGGAMPIDRISAIDARNSVKSGDALLVCSYDDDRCEAILLEGAILKGQFESELVSIQKTQPIIFY